MTLHNQVSTLVQELAVAREQNKQLSIELARAQQAEEVARTRLEQIRAALRPVLGYFESQWITDKIRPAWRALVEFVGEGTK